MKFSTDIKTKVLQCILYSIFNNVPQNINLITNNNIKFRNDFWSALDILNAINVNPKNQIYRKKLQNIVKGKLEYERNKAGKDQQLLKQVKELKTKKPVIVSMGDYAASGGYYISCVADTIVAEPTTLTGSIGIFGMIPNVKGLTDKIGLSYDVVKTNKYADFGNIMRPFNEDEKSLLQMMITEGYDTFVTRCAEGRHMTKEAIEKIAEGRVWTGETAKELGLVDELGGIDKALDIAVAKVGIEGYTVVSYPEKQDFLSSLLDTKPTNYVESQLLKSKLGEYYQQFGLLKNLQEQSMIQARIPFELNIK